MDVSDPSDTPDPSGTGDPSDTGDRSDTAWAHRLEAGGEKALADAFEHFRPRLRRMVDLRMDARLAGRVDPSDVVQDTYLDASKQLRLYLARPEVSVFVWLRRLTWERMLSLRPRHLEAQKRDVHRELSLPEESSVLLARSLLDVESPSERLTFEGCGTRFAPPWPGLPRRTGSRSC